MSTHFAPRARRTLRRALLAFALLLLPRLVAAQGDAQPNGAAAAASPEVYVVRWSGDINPAVARYLSDSLDEADARRATLWLLELDTPGGSMAALHDITKAMLSAQTPTAVYVTPSGAQAASAGFFILMAADLAAMGPSTRAGAAAAVNADGHDLPKTMRKKVEQDSTATIRGLAERRGRNAALAEEAVTKARSFTSEELLAAGLIDAIAEDRGRLLAAIDGRTLERPSGRKTRLATAAAAVVERPMRRVERLLAAIAHPGVIALLFSLGMMGLAAELYTPGAVLPGVLGSIFIVLALFGASVLPIDHAGLALLGLAAIFFLAEIKVTSYGLLSLAGFVCLVLGGMMLRSHPDPALRIDWGSLLAAGAILVLGAGSLAALGLRAQRRRPKGGAEGLVGEVGVARSPLAPAGRVFVHGELWNAVSEAPAAPGDRVVVTAVEGMSLRVRPAGSLV